MMNRIEKYSRRTGKCSGSNKLIEISGKPAEQTTQTEDGVCEE